MKAYQRDYEERTRRRSWLSTKYGITPEQYEQMAANQGGLCHICTGPQHPRYRYLDVDHDHKTGVVRGLLCRGCNTSLGRFHDDPALLERAAAYLRGEL